MQTDGRGLQLTENVYEVCNPTGETPGILGRPTLDEAKEERFLQLVPCGIELSPSSVVIVRAVFLGVL